MCKNLSAAKVFGVAALVVVLTSCGTGSSTFIPQSGATPSTDPNGPSTQSLPCDAFAGGDGSSGNPFQIATHCQLKLMNQEVSTWTASFILKNDLDMTGQTYNPGMSFAGEFNGNGHVISNWRTETPFFDSLTGTVRDLNLQNVDLRYNDILRRGIWRDK